MTIGGRARRLGRILAVGVLAVVLAGCAVIGGDPIPKPYLPDNPVAMLYGLSAEGEPQWVRYDDAGNVQAFVPLLHAREALARATGSDAAARYAPDALAHARAALRRAENVWASIAAAPSDYPRKLARAAYHAHQAKRYAQIAYRIGAREVGLRQLFEIQAALRSGAQPRAARDKPDGSGDTRKRAEPESGGGSQDSETATTTPEPVAEAATTTAGAEAEDLPWLGRQLMPGTVGEVHFAPGEAQLTDSRQTIANLAWFLDRHSRYGLLLIGYADKAARGAARARAVKQALVAAGVDGARITVKSGASASAAADAGQDTAVVAIVVRRD